MARLREPGSSAAWKPGWEKESLSNKARIGLTVLPGMGEDAPMFLAGVLTRRLVLPVLVAFMGLTALAAEEQEGEKPRVWTSADGKKLTGVLEEKGEGWVKLKVKGKLYKLKVEKLSQADRDYLKTHKVMKPLVIRTELKSHKDTNLKKTVKTLDLEFKNMEEKTELYLLVVWIAKKKSDERAGAISIKEKLECFYDRDGVYSHEAGFYDNKNGDAYRGWAIRVMDMKGRVLAERASASSYLRYLKTVVTRWAPRPPVAEEE